VSNKGAQQIAVGKEGGKVVMRFPSSVTWMELDPDQAALIGESMIMSAAGLGVRIEIPQEKREITPMQRAALDARVSLVLKNMIEKNAKPEYMAKQLIDVIMREME